MIVKYNRLFLTYCLEYKKRNFNEESFLSLLSPLTGIIYSTTSPLIKLILHKPGGLRSLAFMPPNNQSVSSIILALCEYLKGKIKRKDFDINK